MIRFDCKKCGATLNVSDDKAGKKGPCPQCGALVRIPSLQDATQHSLGSSPGVSSKTAAPVGRATRSPISRKRLTRNQLTAVIAGGMATLVVAGLMFYIFVFRDTQESGNRQAPQPPEKKRKVDVRKTAEIGPEGPPCPCP